MKTFCNHSSYRKNRKLMDGLIGSVAKLWFCLFCLGFLFSHTLCPQNIKAMLNTGINFSQVDGDRLAGFKRAGLWVGASASIPVNEKFSFHLETQYSEKGSYLGNSRNDGAYGSYKLILNYLEIPVMLNFYDKTSNLNFGLGCSWGRLVKFREFEDGIEINTDNQPFPCSQNDMNAFINIYREVWNNFHIGLRWSYSVFKIRDKRFFDGEILPQYNNVLGIKLIYVFGKTEAQ